MQPYYPFVRLTPFSQSISTVEMETRCQIRLSRSSVAMLNWTAPLGSPVTLEHLSTFSSSLSSGTYPWGDRVCKADLEQLASKNTALHVTYWGVGGGEGGVEGQGVDIRTYHGQAIPKFREPVRYSNIPIRSLLPVTNQKKNLLPWARNG